LWQANAKNEAKVQASKVSHAVAAAVATASAAGLTVDDAAVLQNSNRLAVRLLPCKVLARVAPGACPAAPFEVELAQLLMADRAPVARLEPRVEPRVYERDGFTITLWTYYEPVAQTISPTAYSDALQRLHAALRNVNVTTPHFMDRVTEADQIVNDRDRSPALSTDDRRLLGQALGTFSREISATRPVEQLLHGEPHPGNVLNTDNGLLFIDLETCCRGPVEFDLAHLPEEVGGHYSGANQDLLRQCRVLVLAMITAWRWDRDDDLPNGRRLGIEWLGQLRATLDRGADARD
jgi:predicted trehalose synthase